MIIGSKRYKNKKVTGELKFSTGKRIYLNSKEWEEFKARLQFENGIAIIQSK